MFLGDEISINFILGIRYLIGKSTVNNIRLLHRLNGVIKICLSLLEEEQFLGVIFGSPIYKFGPHRRVLTLGS